MRNIFILILLLSSLGLAAQSSSVKKLEQQKKQVEKDIAYTNTLINKTLSAQKVNLDNLNLIHTNIVSRKRLINSIDNQLTLLAAEIAEKQKQVARLYDDLGELKENYAKMVNFAYRNRNAYTQLMYVLAAEDLNQAYRRLSYLRAYSEHRINQANQITRQSDTINHKLLDLREKKAEQEYLFKQKTKELLALNAEEKQYQLTLSRLKTKEKELKKDLDKKRAQATKLNKQIEDAIAEEARREEARRREAAKKSKAAAAKMAEAEVVGNTKFEKMRGRLPMPVSKGVIVTRFGVYDHPVLKGIKVNSNGIDISTTDGAPVMVVADGTVRRVFSTGEVTNVLVQHGLYYTIYTHLKSITVKAGDEIRAQQVLGLVAVASDSDRAILHFELWRQMTKLDPELWLAD